MRKAVDFIKAVLMSYVLDWLRSAHPRWGVDILSLSEAKLGLRKTNMLIELGEELLYGSPESSTATTS